MSDVIDAKLATKWGAALVASGPARRAGSHGRGRAGNVAEPDDTWTDWSVERTDPKESAASILAARYLQYRVTFSAMTPRCHRAAQPHRSLRDAQPGPEVTALDVPNSDAVRDAKRREVVGHRRERGRTRVRRVCPQRKLEGLGPDRGRLSKTDYDWDDDDALGSLSHRVVASDRPDNNEETALTAIASACRAVAHDAPAVT